MKQLAFVKRSNGSHWVGDGFPVRTIFTYQDLGEEISPFLLMDYAGPAHFEPSTRRRGVGAHPHRGFETVTIVYAGGVAHRDSAGGGGSIGPGDVQWMTAGSGVLHEEFHSADFARTGGQFEMIQLWVNLPARHKMTAPAYQAITDEQTPRVTLPGDAGTMRLIAGEYAGIAASTHTFTSMNVWDMHLKAGGVLSFDFPAGDTLALFVLRGALSICSHTVRSAELAVMEREGSRLQFEIIEDAVVLLLSGRPLGEPVVGHGPFVMNSQQEIERAIRDFSAGRFNTAVLSG